MIKCNVTISGTVSKAAQVRTNKEGKPFTTFGVAVVIPNPSDINKTIEVSVIKDGAENTADYVVGNRIEMTGELTFRKREDNLYFNFTTLSVNHTPAIAEDGVKGELHMKGTVGKSIDSKTTKSGKNMLIFSAYSGEKTENGFAFTWVRFVQFDAVRPDWLQPKTTIEAKGELELSVFNDRINLGCKLTELLQWEKPAFVPREAQMNPLSVKEKLPFYQS